MEQCREGGMEELSHTMPPAVTARLVAVQVSVFDRDDITSGCGLRQQSISDGGLLSISPVHHRRNIILPKPRD